MLIVINIFINKTLKKIFGSPFNIILVIFVLLIVSIYAMTSSPNPQTNNSILITTSFYPLYFFTSQIAQKNAEIKNITPAGAEPHDYEPTAKDLAFIEKSDLVILNGGGLEPWADKIKKDLEDKNVIIVITGEGVINRETIEEGQKIQDPHIWLSPPLAKRQVDVILNGLIEVDLKNKELYETNATNLKQKLDDLDNKFKTGLSNCTQKDIVTSHAAFSYLASTYGFNQIPISGVSPDEEPSTKELAEVADFAKNNNVKYIFFETLVSPKLSETIASEVGAKTLVLNPIEGIDEEEAKQGKNYFTIMEDNLKNLRVALECT